MRMHKHTHTHMHTHTHAHARNAILESRAIMETQMDG